MSPEEERGRVAAQRWPILRAALALEERGILAAALLFFAIGAITNRYFLTVANLSGILQSITFLGFLAVGVGLALIAGEIDISVGSIYGLVSVITALALHRGLALGPAIGLGLGTGLICGLINGVVAQLIKVSAVVVTLATLGIYRAIALVIANGSPVTGLPALPGFFNTFGQHGLGPVSYIALLFLFIA
ncbi:MAG: ABC transporter permease, partial [Acetobacteraceae bacterium]